MKLTTAIVRQYLCFNSCEKVIYIVGLMFTKWILDLIPYIRYDLALNC